MHFSRKIFVCIFANIRKKPYLCIIKIRRFTSNRAAQLLKLCTTTMTQTTIAQLNEILANVKVSAPQVSEYRLMYKFGAWVTKSIICAENDAEAIFDADMDFSDSRLGEWKHGVALFCGNRMVKSYR